MLTLNRRLGESIVIPNSRMRITVVRLSGGQAALRFEAPRDIAVYREEIYQSSLGGKPSLKERLLLCFKCNPRSKN